MRDAGTRAGSTVATRAHALCLRVRQQARTTGLPALGTSNTQGDGGVNDSFRHLHPSGDSSGGNSARMTCVIPRSTDKGKMERQGGERPNEAEGQPATRSWCLPVHRRCGPVRRGPRPAETSFPSLHILSGLATRGMGAEQWVALLAGTPQKHTGLLHALCRGRCGLGGGRAHTTC